MPDRNSTAKRARARGSRAASAGRRTASRSRTRPRCRRACGRRAGGLRSSSFGSSSGPARIALERRRQRRVGVRRRRHVIRLELLQRPQPVVDAAVDLDHVEPLLEQRDRRQEALALQAVRATARPAGSWTSSRTRRPASNSAVRSRPRIIASAMSETWNSSKQMSRQRRAMRSATIASGSTSRFSVAQVLVDVAHERMEMDARLAADRRPSRKSRPSGSSCRGRRRPRDRRRAGRRAARTAA